MSDPTDSLAAVIAAWLAAKTGRSGSVRTARAYADTLGSFRAAAQRAQTDLDGDRATLAQLAATWAGSGDPTPATFNQRLAIVSSFYAFAYKRGMLEGANPIDRVERRTVQAYSGAVPLDFADLRARLVAIDRTTLAGRRDYALLTLALLTGRRLTELAGLRWGDLVIRDTRVVVTWRRVKGGETRGETLDAAASRPLLAWLRAYYGDRLDDLPAAAPIWVALSRNVSSEQAMGTNAISQMCLARLGTSKVHTLRHTTAVAMEEAGASLSDIQEQLGHKNPATTGIYLKRLRAAGNKHAAALAELFGLTDE
jgi:integrase